MECACYGVVLVDGKMKMLFKSNAIVQYSPLHGYLRSKN
jgi:hypothetical protein